MNDRELLELAAKAAGMLVKKNTVAVDSDDHLIGIKVRATEREKYHTWNPLDDDGDALRLAVKLKLETEFGSNFVNVGSSHHDSEWHMARESDVDLYAATRRAIVRAAAEIGRNIKMNGQPEALRVAEHLELYATFGRGDRSHEAAAELRRLHEKNKRLLEVLKEITPSMPAADAPCHYGIVPQERCKHCGRIAEAIAAIKTAEEAE